MKRLDVRGCSPRMASIGLTSALTLAAALPAQAQFFTATGAVNTAPTNIPVPPLASVFDYTGNTLYVGNSAPGSFSSIAGALLKGNGLTVGAGVGGSGTVTLSGAGNLTQLGGAQNRLEVGNWGTGSLAVSAGAILDAAIANAGCGPVFCGSFIGNGAGSTGTLTITGSGSEVRTLQNFVIGQTAVFTTAVNGFDFGTPGGTTNAFVDVLAGGTLRTQQATVGSGPNNAAALGTERGFGTVVVDGAGSRWIVTPNTVDGTAAGVVVGNRIGGQGTVDVRNGGQLLIDGSSGSGPNDFFNIGQTGGRGSVTVSGVGSSLVVTGNSPVIQVGRSGAGADGSFSVLAGATASSIFMNIGRDGAHGAVTIDGSGSQIRLVGVANPGAGGTGVLVGSLGNGQLTISNGGSLLIGDGGADNRAQPISPGMTVAREAGSTGSLTVTGPGSVLQMTTTSQAPAAGVADNFNPGLLIGRDSGATGQLTITNGGKVILQGGAISTVANSRTTAVHIGGGSDTAPGGSGTALVSGAGSELRITGSDAFLSVGRGLGANGQLTVADGANVSANIMSVGRGVGGTGTVAVDNATVSMSGQQTGNTVSGAAFVVGTGGGTGTATFTNGSRLDLVNLGSAGASVSIGGSGAFPLGNGSLALTGGSQLNITAATGLAVFNVGRDGTGTALVRDASSVNIGDGSAYIGRLAGSDGTMTLQGGSSLSAGYVGVGRNPAGDGGTGRLMVESGSTVTAGTIEIGTNGFVGGSGGTLDGDVILHGTLSPGNSPGSIIINRSIRTGSGHLILDVASDGAGGYITDQVLLTTGTTFSFTGLEVTFNFLGNADPESFAASGGFDLDTFLRSLDVVTGMTSDLSDVFAPGQSWSTVFASATFDAVRDGAALGNIDITADGAVTITAVPEPETWAMLWLGLGAVGWAARRRKRALA